MTRYVLLRIGQAILVIVATYTIAFLLLWALPSDPASLMLHRATGGASGGAALDDAALASVRAQYGLDLPLYQQYFTLLGGALTGDLGQSIFYGQPVADLIGAALPSTIALAGGALVVGVVLGVVLAWGATFAPLFWLRSALQALPAIGVALPTFWVGLILLQVFAFSFGWFPPFGDSSPAALVLPTITLAIPTAAYVAQVLQASLEQTLTEPYIQTAKAKGASPERVQWRHALRNAMIPALTVAGVLVGTLLGGSVVVETVFSRNGLGRLAEQAVSAQDIPLVMGIVLFCALVFVAINLIVDLLYPLIDPRIARGSRKEARA